MQTQSRRSARLSRSMFSTFTEAKKALGVSLQSLRQVKAIEDVARGCGRSMTRFEFACPQCRQTIIAWARLLSGAVPDPSTAIMLQCNGLSLSCGWRGAQLLH